ncbi:hypothetical protein OIDMADRAFT_105934 [Oidiodendron maius Zn]|uniref:ADF-H domain-containing protein n=1 Tax=Oidiodendron maius (strain Zn) TaxID=913774 RepID=A0A0C3D355_OIDMZ|nr:hypothetical protein OIDMADRAFT_105934 [Oidiodendron maius Zn]
MSLNGLDDASIREAHEAAAAELGGWFLLKYTSRDEVGLLGRGTGGIVEIRNAISQYEEPQPLYGFLRYRRRSVIIKFIPDDCSRLIKDVPPPPPPPTSLPPPTITDEIGELRSPEPQARSPTKTIDEPRKSSQSSRPYLYSYSSYGSSGKPKVKLGPRPSLDASGRPHTSSATSQYRPVSTLPAGLKLFSKTTKAVKERPKSQYNVEATSMLISPPPIPESDHGNPARPHTSGGRPSTSSGTPIRTATMANPPKSPTITPEKARLMKALQLRKKQMKSVPSGEHLSPTTSDVPSPETSSTDTPKIIEGAPKDVHDTLAMLNDMAKQHDTVPAREEDSGIARGEESRIAKEEESGIAFDASSAMKTEGSDATHTNSYPVSPISASEKAESTKASSISESTEETIQESNNSAGTVKDYKKEVTQPVSEESEEFPTEKVQSVETTLEKPATDESEVAPTMDATTVETTAVEEVVGDSVPTQEYEKTEESSPRTELAMAEETTSKPVPSTEEPVQIPIEQVDERSVPEEPTPSIETFVDELPRLLPVAYQPPSLIKPQKNEVVVKVAALVEPIRTDFDVTDRSRAGSEANFSSDDDLMEELQSAVVQEAKPISVSKSPMSPHFPTLEKSDMRAASNPLLNDGRQSQMLSPLMTTPDSARSVSTSAIFFNNVNQQASRPIVKKVNLGSGISQRIKALEKLSKAAPADTPPSTSSGTSSTFFSVRKGSVRNSKAPSIMDRANSLTRNNTPSPPTSQQSSPETLKLHNRSESVQSRVDALAANSSPITQIQRQRPESISVTARIIRDPNQPFPPKSEVSNSYLDLKQSPLVIDHQKASPMIESSDERLSSSSSKGSKSTSTIKEKRTSMSVVKDFIKEGRASFSEHRRSSTLESSGSSVLSPTMPPPAYANKSPRLGRSPSISSRKSGRGSSPTKSIDASSPIKDEGKSNRASRLLRRMSSSMSSGRKTLSRAISPTLREESEMASIDGSRDVQPVSPLVTSINIGDVNVQFPDTLLWKRRFMMLDSQGFLILSPALSAKDQKNAGATRRMHMSGFRTPMIPDVEMQELPNSVVLEFIEGSGLQIACEDRGGQGRILSILQDAHSQWANHIQ